MNINVFGNRSAHQLAPEVLGIDNQLTRHDPIFEYLLVMVDIVQKQVQGAKPLDQAALDLRPFAVRDNARHQIHGHRFFEALIVAVDRKCHALIKHAIFSHLRPPLKVDCRE